MKLGMAEGAHTHHTGKSVAASFIFVAMLVAALSLWTVLPVTWLYIGSKVSKTQFPAEAPYAVVIVGLIASIILVAWLISRLNRLYMEGTGTNRLAPMRPSWMRSMRDTAAPASNTTVVEAVLMGSVLLATLALTTWFFLLAGSPLPDQ
jgi:DNA-binding transcriptional regulator YbjK